MRISDWSSDVCSSDLTEFTGYSSTAGEATVIGLVKDGKPVGEAKAGDDVTVLTNQTPFYGESGGQMGDAGTIAPLEGAKATVSDTGKPLGGLQQPQEKLEAGTPKEVGKAAGGERGWQ